MGQSREDRFVEPARHPEVRDGGEEWERGEELLEVTREVALAGYWNVDCSSIMLIHVYAQSKSDARTGGIVCGVLPRHCVEGYCPVFALDSVDVNVFA